MLMQRSPPDHFQMNASRPHVHNRRIRLHCMCGITVRDTLFQYVSLFTLQIGELSSHGLYGILPINHGPDECPEEERVSAG